MQTVAIRAAKVPLYPDTDRRTGMPPLPIALLLQMRLPTPPATPAESASPGPSVHHRRRPSFSLFKIGQKHSSLSQSTGVVSNSGEISRSGSFPSVARSSATTNRAFEGHLATEGLLGMEWELQCIQEVLQAAQTAQELVARAMASAGDKRLLTAAAANDVKVRAPLGSPFPRKTGYC
jgi:hypothetical protein